MREKMYIIEMMSDGAIRCSSMYGNEEETIFDNENTIEDLNKFLQKKLKDGYVISVIKEIE